MAGKTINARLIRENGEIQDLPMSTTEFFFDLAIEEELRVSTDHVDFYWPKNNALVYDIFARDKGKVRNGHASALVGQPVFGDVLLIPRRYIRETPLRDWLP